MSRLDALGLDALGTPWKTPESQPLLLSEVVWERLRPQRDQQAPVLDSTILRQYLGAVGKLAATGIWFAAQLSAGPGRWLSLRALPARVITTGEYDALVTLLQESPRQDRIASERVVTPGVRQRTLWEPGRGGGVMRPILGGNGQRSAGYDNSVALALKDMTRVPGRCKQPWQYQPRLPDAVSFDLASDAPDFPPAPPGWELLRRNGRLLVRAPSGVACQVEAAQASMLELLNQGLDQVAFLTALMDACTAQQRHDDGRTIHWSRHLLACMARVTGARGLIGCRSVTFHPHFWWFSSPDDDESLGSVREWPADECILLLDAFPPGERNALMRRAFGHLAHTWILRMVEPGEASTRDTRCLVNLKAQLFSRLPRHSLVIQARGCWSEAQFDAKPTPHAVEIWRLGRADAGRLMVSPLEFRQALGSWDERREDFHWPGAGYPVAWDYYRESQQDFAQMAWSGMVAAIDGSVDRRSETMGAGVVVGAGRQPEVNISFPVGGPLSSLRAEAASLDGLLDAVANDQPLLVFTDCLVLLVILHRWGQPDFWPDPEDIKHIDVIGSCIQKLRGRPGPTRLVKVKSHSGLLMNDRADALADQGRGSEDPLRWPGPRKLDPLALSARREVRKALGSIPDHNVADKQLIRRAVEGVELIAARMKGTAFSCEMLHDPTNCRAVLAAVSAMPDSTTRLWIQAVTGQYPTSSRLHVMFPLQYPSAACPWCQSVQPGGNSGVPETLSHFLTACPRFREARTEAHNRSWRAITREIERVSPTEWQFYVDMPVRATGLLPDPSGPGGAGLLPGMSPERDRPVTAQVALQATRLLNLRPDAIAVNPSLKRIAILEHSRPYDGMDRDRPVASQPLPGSGDRDTDSGVEDDGQALALRAQRALNPPPEQSDLVADGHPARPGFARESESVGAAGADDGEVSAGPESLISTDSSRRRIREARLRKIHKYQALADALLEQASCGWSVQVLPWVVGVRGVVDAAGIQRAMAYLEIPTSKRGGLLRKSAVASVEALVYMHKVRTSGASRASIQAVARQADAPAEGRVSKRSRGAGEAGSCMERWKRLATDPMRAGLRTVDH